MKKEGIPKKGVKKGDGTTLKNIPKENLFDSDVVGTARFGLFFQSFFAQTNTQASYVGR